MKNKPFFWCLVYFKWLILSVVSATAKEQTIASLKVPIEINSDNGIVCERNKSICTAYGNVVVTYKEYTLNCDKLVTYFRSTNHSKNELYKIEAIGHAVLRSLDKTIEAKLLKAFLNKNTIGKYDVEKVEAFNDVVVITQKEVAKAAYGHYQPGKNLMILKNEVQITNQEGQMHGSYAEVDLDKGISKMLKEPSTQKQGKQLKESSTRVKVLILPKIDQQ